MADFLKRLIDLIVMTLLTHTARLARLTVARHAAAEYEATLAEVARQEAAGHPRLAALLRRELTEALDGDLAADTTDTTPLPAVNGEGNQQPPFGLPGPADAALSRPEGQGALPRRRGRPTGKNAEPAQDAPREQATESADPSTPPISNSNHRP